VPGVCWPAVPEVPAGEEPPAGAACAVTQEGQRRIAENKKRLFTENTLVDNLTSDIGTPPVQICFGFFLPLRFHRALSPVRFVLQVRTVPSRNPQSRPLCAKS
jgi:hypothetical protein